MDVNRPNSHLSIILQSNGDHLLLFFGVSAWLMSSGASRVRWQVLLLEYWAGLVLYTGHLDAWIWGSSN